MRIAQLSDSFLPIMDGVARVTLAYTETLCKMGHELTVIAPLCDTGPRGGYPFEIVDFKAVRLPLLRQYKTAEARWDKHYMERIKMIPLDIVHTQSPFAAGTEALRLAVERNIPLVGMFHSKYEDDFVKAVHSRKIAHIGTRIVVDFYNRCDEVWTVSESSVDVMREYGYKGDVQVMLNGVSMKPVSREKLDEVNARFDLGASPVLLYVGQLDWKKNLLNLILAAAEMKKAGTDFRLVFAGQGINREEMENKLTELGLMPHTRFTGHITEADTLAALYQRASVYAFPSLYDTASMTVREAAALGTPSVMVRGATTASIVTDGENGFLCENAPEDLARVITKAVTDPEALRRAGEGAKRTISIPWEQTMEKAVRRYENLIELGKRGKLKDKSKRLL